MGGRRDIKGLKAEEACILPWTSSTGGYEGSPHVRPGKNGKIFFLDFVKTFSSTYNKNVIFATLLCNR